MNNQAKWIVALALVALGFQSVRAHAQGAATSPPPTRNYIDANGVDLVTLQFHYSTTEVTIGQPGSGGMAYTRSYYLNGWGDNYTGTISSVGTTYQVSIGMSAETFTQSGSTFTPAQGQGSSLTYSSGTGTYTYTSAQGAVATFDNATSDLGYAMGMIQTLVYPTGETLTFNYLNATECAPPDCSVPVAIRRLQSVTNNFGYQIRFNYALGGTTVLYDQVSYWYQRTGVVGINMAVDYCNPVAESCPAFTVSWPSVTYAYPTSTTETVTDPLGRTTTHVYGSRLVGIRRPSSPSSDNMTINNDGTSAGLVTSITNGTGTWTYSHTDNGNQRTTTVTDPLGHTRIVTGFIPTGRTYTDTNGAGKTTSYAYDSAGRLSSVTFPEGGHVEYTYDSRGNVTQTKQVSKTPGTPADIVTSAGYDATCASVVKCNKPNYAIDARGAQTDYTYDATHGGLLTVTAPAPSSGAVRPQTRYTYTALYAWYKNSSGSIVQAPTPVYRQTMQSSCATLASCSNGADEARTTITYGSGGVANNLLPTAVTRSSGDLGLSATSSMTYDSIGNLVAADGPLSGSGDTTRYRYDAARQRIGTISPDPDGAGPLQMRAARLTYNVDGQVTTTEQGTVVDAGDTAWSNFAVLARQTASYDSIGRVTQTAVIAVPGNSAATVTQYSYDAANRTDCVAVRMNPNVFGSLPGACSLSAAGSDGPDRIVRFTYDAAGRLIKQTSGYGTASPMDAVSVTYTDDGLRSTVADGSGHLSTFEYDGFDRMAKLRYPLASGGSTSSTTDYDQYTYDAAGNVTQVQRRDGQLITFTYDALNRLQTKSPPVAADAVAYSYDNLGRLLSAATTGQTVSFTYDALDRVSNQVSPQGTWVSGWDIAGRRTQLTWPDGFHVNYDYSTLGEVTAIRENGATSGVGVLASFAYDDLGRRTTLSRGNGVTTSYGYDAISRLSSLTQDISGTANDQTYTFTYNAASQVNGQATTNATYDWNGTPLNTTYGVNGLNQITTAGAVMLSHDARGNLTNDGTKTYGFDAENRLTSASGSPGATLSYDPAGRLSQTTGAATTRFAYDGANVAGEYNGSNAMLRRYVYGPGMDEPLVWYEGSGTTDRRWLVTDVRGSVIAVTDGTGAATQIDRYDEYGMPGVANPGRFQYTGQMWLPEAGLYHYKARAYQPTLGRFLQTDPMGYGAGMNLYAYVANDPVNLVDPSGQCIIVEPVSPDNGQASIGPGCNPEPEALPDWGPMYWPDYTPVTPPVDPGLVAVPTLSIDDSPQGTQNLLDKLKDWICKAPAATASVQGQVDAGLTFDAEAQLSLTLTTHGQFIVQYQQGTLWGLNVGAAASVSAQGGVLWNDAPAGTSPTSSYVANGFMVDTFGGGGSIQINGDGAQGSWSSPRARAGPTGSVGWGAFVGGGKVEGVQWATAGICGGK